MLPIYRCGASPIILMMAFMAYNVILLGAADYFGWAWAVFTRGYTLKSAVFHIAHIQGLAVAGPLIMVAVVFSLPFKEVIIINP